MTSEESEFKQNICRVTDWVSSLWINMFCLACLVWECSRILEFVFLKAKNLLSFCAHLYIEVSSHHVGSYLKINP